MSRFAEVLHLCFRDHEWHCILLNRLKCRGSWENTHVPAKLDLNSFQISKYDIEGASSA